MKLTPDQIRRELVSERLPPPPPPKPISYRFGVRPHELAAAFKTTPPITQENLQHGSEESEG